jgi:hypothetical protein
MEIDWEDDEQPVSVRRRLSLAFWLQYNVVFLLGAICFSLSLATPLPAAAGAAGEFLWLLVATAFAGTSRWIESHNRRANAAADDPSGLHRDLEPSYRTRASGLKQAADRVREACRRNAGVSRGESRSVVKRLGAIRETFLRFAGIHQRLSRFLAGIPAAQIDMEMARLTEELAVEKDPVVKMSLRQALLLSRRRLQQRDQMANTLRGIEVQMNTIETSCAYLDSIAAQVESGSDLESELDALVSRISPADIVEAEVGSALAASLAPPSMRPLAG